MSQNLKVKTSRRKTLADVAALAGVSVSTASAVLGNKKHCFASASTKQQVFDAARQVGYRPNYMARGLRGQKTHTVGLVLFGFDKNTITNAKLQSIEDTAWHHGYRLLIGTHKDDRDRLESYIDEFLGRSIDGLVLWPTQHNDHVQINEVRKAGVGVVTIEAPTDFGVPDVRIDREHGGYLQVKHLLEVGRHKLAFVFTSHTNHTGSAKVRGIRRALGEANLKLEDFPVIEDPRPAKVADAGVVLTEQLLATGREFDAVVTLSDRVALGSVATLLSRGLRVPEDVAVIGFDDEFAPQGMVVPISTIRQPVAIGPVVFNLLLPQIAGESLSDSESRVRLQPELIVRESTVKGAGGGQS